MSILGALVVRISVDSKSLTHYGTTAEEAFKSIRKELEGLVHGCATVPYEGPNSHAFKTACGTMSEEFSSELLADVGKFTTAVREVTTSIAQSLGGHPVVISFNGQPITAPTPKAGNPDFTMVDTGPLSTLKHTVSGHFTKINGHLDHHLHAFKQAKWEGNAREAAHKAITAFTTNTKSDVEAARTKIGNFIDEQIASVTSSDQA